MSDATRFPVFILVSFVVFFAILKFVTRQRASRPSAAALVGIAAVVVVGGMVFAKFGQNTGWPWWIYYTVPAVLTLVVPPVVFRFSAGELWQYLALAALSSPVIHVLFSFLLGWHEYMPFIRVPSLRELLSHASSDLAAVGASLASR
jgi:hypothetical protein